MVKNTKIKIRIAIYTAILIFIIISSTVFARQIGEFAEFKITYSGNLTGFLLKIGEDNSPFILNLNPSRDLSPIVVRYRMENINERRRSDEHRLQCGYRNENSNWASKGYSYVLRMARENWWDGTSYITGSWSPDK